MSSMVEINMQIVGGPMLARRNMFRCVGNPIQVKVIDGDTWYMLNRIIEEDFDDRDITVIGIPSEYCLLAPGLCALWPTTASDVEIEVKTEIQS